MWLFQISQFQLGTPLAPCDEDVGIGCQEELENAFGTCFGICETLSDCMWYEIGYELGFDSECLTCICWFVELMYEEEENPWGYCKGMHWG